MKIAVATSKFATVTGHAGRARKWLVYQTDETGAPIGSERVELPPALVFHHHDGTSAHPLDGISVLITHSAGEGFLRKMAARGVTVALTAETDPERAVRAHGTGTLSPPKPRPIGELLCKAIDKLGGH